MRTLTFEGSHGSFTACAVSGHIIRADKCSCGDCEEFGGYTSIALVDVFGTDPAVIAYGGGDILDAALIYRDGGYLPAMIPGERGRDDIAGLLPAPIRTGDTRPMYHPNPPGAPEAVMYHAWRTVDGVDEYCDESESPDGWCVYTRHANDAGGGFDCSEEMDFPTREEAEREAGERAQRLGVDVREY